MNAKRLYMDNNTETLYGMENDMVLLQFLRSKNSDRFTKLDAFCDLIGRMSEQSRVLREFVWVSTVQGLRERTELQS